MEPEPKPDQTGPDRSRRGATDHLFRSHRTRSGPKFAHRLGSLLGLFGSFWAHNSSISSSYKGFTVDFWAFECLSKPLAGDEPNSIHMVEILVEIEVSVFMT